MPILSTFASIVPALAMLLLAPEGGSTPQAVRNATAPAPPGTLFVTAESCMACHNTLLTPAGHDVSIGFEWRSSMMANSARDPYWHAGVRREVQDHPEAGAAIEDECSACHMPMMRKEAHLNGGKGEVFQNLPPAHGTTPVNVLAADGVSCSVCHQITPDKLGSRDSFNAGFVVATPSHDQSGQAGTSASRRAFGPYPVDNGRARIMGSASTFTPTEAAHIRTSETCATCHTLYTHALGAGGTVIGELPEQMPFQEWLHSGYRKTTSCQDCHMPVVEQDTAVSSVLGQPRPHFSRHEFRGANFFMPLMLNRYRTELAVTALPQELDATARRSVEYLEAAAATIEIAASNATDGTLTADVAITNRAGHKLPSAYPSRRAWLHVTVLDANGRTLFESGAFSPDGSIEGNDNDADASRFEPHHAEIRSPGQVQIYESVMADKDGRVTTGLLSGVRYVKDNRVLPAGFDKATASKDVAVHGEAMSDPDFTGGGDRVRYVVAIGNAPGPFRVAAELCYQSIGFRWAQNLEARKGAEPERFVRYYRSMAPATRAVIAKAGATVR